MEQIRVKQTIQRTCDETFGFRVDEFAREIENWLTKHHVPEEQEQSFINLIWTVAERLGEKGIYSLEYVCQEMERILKLAFENSVHEDGRYRVSGKDTVILINLFWGTYHALLPTWEREIYTVPGSSDTI